VFGADSDSLEGITLAALAERGWSLACVESGLDGALLRRFGQAGQALYHGGKQQELQAGFVAQAAQAIQLEFNTSAALAVALFHPLNSRIFPLPSLLRSGKPTGSSRMVGIRKMPPAGQSTQPWIG